MRSIEVVALLVSLLVSANGCDPVTDRHCQGYPEKNVESIEVLPNEVQEQEQEPIVVKPDVAEDPNTNTTSTTPTGPVAPTVTSRENDSDGGGIGAGVIAAASVGGAVVVLAAAFSRRRKLMTACGSRNADDDGISGIDTSAGPSASEGV